MLTGFSPPGGGRPDTPAALSFLRFPQKQTEKWDICIPQVETVVDSVSCYAKPLKPLPNSLDGFNDGDLRCEALGFDRQNKCSTAALNLAQSSTVVEDAVARKWNLTIQASSQFGPCWQCFEHRFDLDISEHISSRDLLSSVYAEPWPSAHHRSWYK